MTNRYGNCLMIEVDVACIIMVDSSTPVSRVMELDHDRVKEYNHAMQQHFLQITQPANGSASSHGPVTVSVMVYMQTIVHLSSTNQPVEIHVYTNQWKWIYLLVYMQEDVINKYEWMHLSEPDLYHHSNIFATFSFEY